MNTPTNIEFDRIWILLKRKWKSSLFIVLAGCACGLFAGVTQEKVYRSEGSILIKRKANASSLTGVGEGITDKEPLYQDSVPLETEAGVISSAPVLELAIKAGSLQQNSIKLITPELILEKLEVKPIQSSDLLRVSYTDKSPDQAARVVDAILTAYLQNNIQTNQNDTVSARQFIEQQIPLAESNLRKVELAIENFKSQNDFLDSQYSQQTILDRITQTKEQITQAKLNALKAQNEANALLQQIGITSKEALSSTNLTQSQGVQEALKNLQETQSKIAISKNSLKPSHPILIDLLEQEKSLKKILSQRIQLSAGGQQSQKSSSLIQAGELQQNTTAKVVNLKAQYTSARSQVVKLKQNLKTYEKNAQALPKLQRRLDELNRRQEAAKLTYSSLINKQEELRVAEDQSSVNARVISPAVVPTHSANPSIALYLLLGGFLGGVMSLANLLLMEARDKSLKSLYEVQQIFGYHVLGVIPFETSLNTPIHLALNSKQSVEVPKFSTKFNQALLGLDTNLTSISSELNSHVIGVTSTIVGEGKSTIAALLAKRLAQRGKKTLIIDADFNHAIQHQIWGLSNDHGLWNYLHADHIGAEMKCKAVEPNLNLLSAGSLSIGSGILFGDIPLSMFAQFKYLVDLLSKQYDYLIIDCPDITSNTNTTISALVKAVDRFILAVRPEVIDTESAMLAKNLLTHSQIRVLGMFVNSELAHLQAFSQFRQNKDSVFDSNIESELMHLLSDQKPPSFASENKEFYDTYPPIEPLTFKDFGPTPQNQMNEQVSLQKLKFWVDEQEQELVMKNTEIRYLQSRLHETQYSNEKEALELRIAEEKERIKIFEESLEGQRRQFRERLELLSNIRK